MPVSLAEVPNFEKTTFINRGSPSLMSKEVVFGSEESQQIQAAMQRKFKYGFNPLSAPEACLQSLVETGVIIPERKAYTRENNFTTVAEAITSGGYLWTGERGWDEERGGYSAFAKWFFRDILQAGIDDLRAKIKDSGSLEHVFELDRRQAEDKTEGWFNLMRSRLEPLYSVSDIPTEPPVYRPRVISLDDTQRLDKNFLRRRTILTGSAFPSLLMRTADPAKPDQFLEEEVDQVSNEVSGSLGYRFKERLGKLRFEVFGDNGSRQTLELSVEQGSIGPFKKLLESMGVAGAADIMDSTQLLESPIDLGNGDYTDIITRWAIAFDQVLEADQLGKSYFCGREIKSPAEKDYQSLMDKQRWLRKEGKGLVDALSSMDFELAKSFYKGVPTAKVMADVEYWRSAKDQTGESVLTSDEQEILSLISKDKPLSRDAAYVLKKNELIRILTIGACIINPKKAEEFFTPQQISYIKQTVEAKPTSVLNQDFIRNVDQMIALAKVTFVLCGGSLSKAKQISGFGSVILMALGLVDATNNLLDPENMHYKPGMCRACGQETEVGRCKICRNCAKHLSDSTVLVPLIPSVSQITN